MCFATIITFFQCISRMWYVNHSLCDTYLLKFMKLSPLNKIFVSTKKIFFFPNLKESVPRNLFMSIFVNIEIWVRSVHSSVSSDRSCTNSYFTSTNELDMVCLFQLVPYSTTRVNVARYKCLPEKRFKSSSRQEGRTILLLFFGDTNIKAYMYDATMCMYLP